MPLHLKDQGRRPSAALEWAWTSVPFPRGTFKGRGLAHLGTSQMGTGFLPQETSTSRTHFTYGASGEHRGQGPSENTSPHWTSALRGSGQNPSDGGKGGFGSGKPERGLLPLPPPGWPPRPSTPAGPAPTWRSRECGAPG